MNVVGVVAEYNPFHNGHFYHLAQAQKRANAQGVIVVMSGSWVQRGEPAVVNKWARAEMALLHGADLVLELPVLYACRSAYWFARGGIQTLQRTGVVTHLAFGLESDQPAILSQATRILATEPACYREKLKIYLHQGLSYPKARGQALQDIFPQAEGLFDKPNNILGLAYLQVLQETGIPFIPVMIAREGSAYESEILNRGMNPSATAIRRFLADNLQSDPDLKQLTAFMPARALSILSREILQGRGPLFFEQLSPVLMALLRRAKRRELLEVIDIGEGLENRIITAALESVHIRDFLDRLKIKRFTYTRLQRFLIHLLLNYTREKEKYLTPGPPYLRVLGFNGRGRRLLSIVKDKSVVPLLVKGAHSRSLARNNEAFRNFWEMDVLSTNLYNLLYPEEKERKGHEDYYRSPLRLP